MKHNGSFALRILLYSAALAIGFAGAAAADEPYEYESKAVAWNPEWEYASASVIHSGEAVWYHAAGENAKHLTVAVNAGHGTAGGQNVTTLCHPDGSSKVTGGTTQAGETQAVAVSSGMTFADGTPEAKVNLALANEVKDLLLQNGWDVLMLRSGDDVQLDNVARTVMANAMADCHIALHYDSTDIDKGVFFLSVPAAAEYRNMHPVTALADAHDRLGSALVQGIADQGFALFDSGAMEMDLTQTSYSTIPSAVLEVGDRVSDHTEMTLKRIAEGILTGLNTYFLQQ